MNLALLSLGSNQQPEHYLALAASELRAAFGDVRFSPVYRTNAVGFAGPDFLNAAAALHTPRDVFDLNDWLHALEDRHGRRRDQPRFSSRTLDVDIVYFNDLIMHGPGNLRLPRPELKYAFVLKPLFDIAPNHIDPVSQRSLTALWSAACLDAPLVDPLVL
ncbi:MAG: 2-amino-4-hydroxy-6-hydroxymethyldihydropteridine pyrophosphokinase [Alphaproteobacteria bacterium ADurb.BinA280]|jgi:2-amino-4-hydroxy-6-hydroxymethyldihydropteridine diphosphokinase|nr:2-amino-4-hydroxy-6-hydroxymethyldihydropteridine diphosphokinase [Xanthomonadales bacterium]MCC6505279.1 2-amino-4-hydroxy-6-hydroxymethyldihydropteridine diphosphokinase [Aquimonas sp.]OPZ12710.1 MAG: 2-amino-4-hydroxy-6-hydroxymethyldihydropteridine pyrophosphokinase [Alphaproteobacteria bacterium ADurb.BinA280]